jgi:hypothetical protein
LERRPGFKKALEAHGCDINWVSIYDLKRYVDAGGLDKPEYYLKKILVQTQVLFVHKEALEYLPYDFLDKLKGCGILTVGFLGDEEWCLEDVRIYAPIFDLSVVYTNKALIAYDNTENNLFKLSVGASFSSFEGLPNDITDLNRDIDVLFIGRPYEPRPKIINHLISEGIDVHVYGSKKWAEKMPEKNYKGFLDHSEYNSTLLKAKIVLGLMEPPENKGELHINAKIFDAAKGGALAVASKYKGFESEYGLKDGQTIISYDDERDLTEKIKYFLKNPEERLDIARRSTYFLREKNDYFLTYSKLIQHVSELSIIEAKTERNTEWLPIKHSNTFESPVIKKIMMQNLVGDVLVLHTEYSNKLVIKRLPIVDSYSVYYRTGTKPLFSIFGLTFCPVNRRVRMPYIPLNKSIDIPPPIKIIFAMNLFLDWVLNGLRHNDPV